MDVQGKYTECQTFQRDIGNYYLYIFHIYFPQVSGVGYNGKGSVCLLPSKEVLKEFSNVSVGKLVEVSVKCVNQATVFTFRYNLGCSPHMNECDKLGKSSM